MSEKIGMSIIMYSTNIYNLISKHLEFSATKKNDKFWRIQIFAVFTTSDFFLSHFLHGLEYNVF